LGSAGTGTFSGNLNSAGLGFSGISSGGSSFSGISYRAGAGMSGAAGGVNTAVSAARYQGIAASNLFASYYASPMAAGLSTSGTASTRSFGAPLFTASTNTNMTSTGLTGGAGTATSLTGSGLGTGSGALIVRPAAANGMPVPVPIAPAAPLQARPDLQNILARSSTLASKEGIKVMSDGASVVLQGSVGSEFDRRMAEALVRMEPGVRQIRNELVVKGP
jgi:hypothetical protein